MLIGERLREFRDLKRLSQGDIEKRSGLFRCYVSRVENSHAVPSIETLEKMARALEVPMYQLFYDGEESPPLVGKYTQPRGKKMAWGTSGKDARYWLNLRRLLGRMTSKDRVLILHMTQEVVARKKSRPGS